MHVAHASLRKAREASMEANSMAEKVEEVVLDRAQVKKAVQALQAFLKTTSTPDSLLLQGSQQISLLFTLWKIPKQTQKIRIPLPHGLRSDTDDVCLFTRDEPNMTSEQTQRFYKRLLEERGVKNVTEVIPYKVLKTEYKPYEAKLRLVGNFDSFLSDDRIRRLLPSHIGKHFYVRKKEPLSVNLTSKHLARDIQRIIQGSTMTVSKKGCCSMARVAHSGMTADEMVDNIEAAVRTVVEKIRWKGNVALKGKVIKLIHLKSESSVALPVYTSDLGHLTEIEEAQRQAREAQAAKTGAKKTKRPSTASGTSEEELPEQIPKLVPIVTPSKKPKLQTPTKKKGLENAPTPAQGKKGSKAKGKLPKKGLENAPTPPQGKKGSKAKGKLPKKAAKMSSQKFKRKVPTKCF